MPKFPTTLTELDAALTDISSRGATPDEINGFIAEYEARQTAAPAIGTGQARVGLPETATAQRPAPFAPAEVSPEEVQRTGRLPEGVTPEQATEAVRAEAPVLTEVERTIGSRVKEIGSDLSDWAKSQPPGGVTVTSFALGAGAAGLTRLLASRVAPSLIAAAETGVFEGGFVQGLRTLGARSLLGAAEGAAFEEAFQPISKGRFATSGEVATGAAFGAAGETVLGGLRVSGKREGLKEIKAEATGEAAKARQVAVAEETRPTFKGAEAKKVQFEEAKVRKKTTESELLKEKGKLETVTGEKVTIDTKKTGFADKKVPTEVTNTFLNNPEKLVDRGDIANNAMKLSEMMPASTKGRSRHAASEIKKYVLDNTSPKFVKLNDEFSGLSDAVNILDNNIRFKTVINTQELPTQLRSRISKVQTLKFKEAEQAKLDLLNKLKKEKDVVGKAMGEEAANLSGKTIDGEAFRSGLEGTLKEQRVSLTRERITQLNKKDLDEIIKKNPKDPRVKQLVQDRKIVEAGKPDKVAANLKGKIMKDGNPDLEKTKQLLLQIEKTPEGNLLREILPKDLVDDIVKTRRITPEKWKTVKKWILIGTVSSIGLGGDAALID